MKIATLVENTTTDAKLKAQFGLSLYIETKSHKILVDLGADGTFIRNARIMGLDLSVVDTVIISHGHDDHGGGLKHFLEVNKYAKVYIQRSAFGKHILKKLGGLVQKDVGLDRSFMNHKQVVLIDGDYKIDDEIMLVSSVIGEKFLPRKQELYKGGAHDLFEHEQNIVLTCNKTVLITGCAHKGIVNIVETAEAKLGKNIDFVIGGFHLYTMPNSNNTILFLNSLARQLQKHKNTQFYTCHCSGEAPYKVLKFVMKDQLHYLATGSTLDL